MDQEVCKKQSTVKSSHYNQDKPLIILFLIEMWERFSYYGMRSLLVLFLTSQLGFTDPKAYTLYAMFAALGYATPVIGGIIADKFFGFFNMVLIGAIIIITGHICLACLSFNNDLIYYGLSLICIGTGFFKGNITNILGLCYTDSDPEREKGFTLFFVGVNLGGALAAISTGYVAYHYGWDYGFGLAAIGMLFGLIIYLIYKNNLVEIIKVKHPEQKLLNGLSAFNLVMTIVAVSVFVFIFNHVLKNGEPFGNLIMYFSLPVLAFLGFIIMKSNKEIKNNFFVIIILITFVALFFALEMQLGSLISLFVDRNVENNIFGFTIPSTVSQAINPISIILIGSVIGRFKNINTKFQVEKFAFGLFTMSICFFLLYFGCVNVDASYLVNYIYLAIAISFMGLGELCIAPFIQSKTISLSPKHMRGFMIGVLTLSLSFSNLFGIPLGKLVSLTPDQVANKAVSLVIYQTSFYNIGIASLIISCIFLIFVPYIKAVISVWSEKK